MFLPYFRGLLLFPLLLGFACSMAKGDSVWLSSLDPTKVEQDWGQAQIDRAVDGAPLKIAGQTFAHGLGTHANSSFVLALQGASDLFTAEVGINDQKQPAGSVEFVVRADGQVLWRSGLMHSGDSARKVEVSVRGDQLLTLEVSDGGDGNQFDHADWAEARLDFTGIPPKPAEASEEEMGILTPAPGPKPRLNGPSVFGVRPGSPFLYTIPATGSLPLKYEVINLPSGLTLDAASGRITGVLTKPGTYAVTFRASNGVGSIEKAFRLVVGDQIALTPPMGWNSWNCWGGQVSGEKVISSARALVEKGLNRHGWTFINIDDGWQGVRGGRFNGIQPNAKFPNMTSLGETIHGLGLKFGLYSSPWRGTYEGHIGSSADHADGSYDWLQSGDHNPFDRISLDPKQWATKRGLNYRFGTISFIKNDVSQFAEWGVDYLKYDWNPIDVPHVKAMSEALKASGRDIIYSLSNNANIKEGASYAQLANAWRTTGDITDNWRSISEIGFNQDRWAPFQGPGHFNDADMLVVGRVGWGNPHPTNLKPNEQYSHLSLWSLLGAPLLIGCDLGQLDEFTVSLLSNDEILEVDQDSLGVQATRLSKEDRDEVLAKPLEDGSWAVGLFNRGLRTEEITIDLSLLRLSNTPHRIRDLWRQKDLGTFTGKFSSPVPSHGVVMIRIF